MRDHRERVDHDEAYRDDPEVTSPEMRPGHGEERPAVSSDAPHVGAAAGLAIGFAGAALAGEVVNEEVEDELAAAPNAAVPPPD